MVSFGNGDPPRTLKIENAERFGSFKKAMAALSQAAKHRPFFTARIDTLHDKTKP